MPVAAKNMLAFLAIFFLLAEHFLGDIQRNVDQNPTDIYFFKIFSQIMINSYGIFKSGKDPDNTFPEDL